MDVWDFILESASLSESHAWIIESAEDVEHHFSDSTEMLTYGGLEAKVFTVDFAYQGFGERSQLRLDTTNLEGAEDLPMRVYARSAHRDDAAGIPA